MHRKQKLSLILLLAILVVLAVILLAVLAIQSRSEQQAQEAAEAEAAASAITEEQSFSALTYDNGSATLSFSLDEDGNWIWSDDPDFPLDDTVVSSICRQLSSLKPQQTITEGDTLEAYGLTSPSATLTATSADGSTLTMAFGNATTDGDSYYMLLNGQESPVYIVADTLYQYMATGIYDMCDLPALPALTEDTVESVSIQGAVSTLLRATQGDTVTWTSGGEDVSALTQVTDLAEELYLLTLEQCVVFKPTEESLSICGFNEPVTLKISYLDENEEENTLTLRFGGENTDGDGRYVQVGEDTTIYLMDASSVSVLLEVAETGLTA